MQGPFGDYQGECMGSLLNTIVRVENIPMHIAEDVYTEDGFVKDHGNTLGQYCWFPELNKYLFYWYNRTYNQQQMIIGQDFKLKAKFRLQLSLNRMACIHVSGFEPEQMKEIKTFICSMLINYMKDPCYKLSQDAGAFFQSGSEKEVPDYILIEFWKPEGAQAWVDYFNANFTA